MRKKTQQKLFLELAKPNEKGISRWVNTLEFIDKYSSLELLNGLSWGRKSSSIANIYILETDKTITSGNKIDRIRLNGFNTSNDKNISQTIRADIKKEILKNRCVILGTHRSCDHITEVDHKDGRKDNPRIMNVKTQVNSDFQPLSKPANDAKRQFCKECKKTGVRYDAKKLGYTISVVVGMLKYDDTFKCKGCFWYDPIAFRKHLKVNK